MFSPVCRGPLRAACTGRCNHPALIAHFSKNFLSGIGGRGPYSQRDRIGHVFGLRRPRRGRFAAVGVPMTHGRKKFLEKCATGAGWLHLPVRAACKGAATTKGETMTITSIGAKFGAVAAALAASVTVFHGAGSAQADVSADTHATEHGVYVTVGNSPDDHGPKISSWCTYTPVVQSNPWANLSRESTSRSTCRRTLQADSGPQDSRPAQPRIPL